MMNPRKFPGEDHDETGELLPTRASLLERLRLWSDNASWQEFFDTYWKLIYRAARSAGLNREDAEEVVQETIVEVAREMPNFQYRPPAEGGSFKQWLRNKTRWRILDHLRGSDWVARKTADRLEEPDGKPLATTEVLGPELEAQWDREWECSIVERALQRLKRQIDSRRYQIFYLLELQDWAAREVARQVGVSLPVVYTTRFRVGKVFRKIVEQLKRTEETS